MPERILTQLLVEIDGVDVLQGVSIIAATNRPDMIDPVSKILNKYFCLLAGLIKKVSFLCYCS